MILFEWLDYAHTDYSTLLVLSAQQYGLHSMGVQRDTVAFSDSLQSLQH